MTGVRQAMCSPNNHRIQAKLMHLRFFRLEKGCEEFIAERIGSDELIAANATGKVLELNWKEFLMIFSSALQFQNLWMTSKIPVCTSDPTDSSQTQRKQT